MIKKFDDPISALNAVAELRHRSADLQINDNFKVTIRTLGAKEETDTFVECMNTWGQAFIYMHKIETLSRAIVKINDVPMADVDFDVRKMIIGNWSQTLVDEIYQEYAKLIGAMDDFFEKIRLTAQTNVIGKREDEKKKEIDSKKGDENGQ